MNRRTFLQSGTLASAFASWSAAGTGARIRGSSERSESGVRDLRLSMDRPARPDRPLQEGLPIGNGRLGALVVGSPARTSLFLSEGSLWLGTDNAALDDDGQFAYQRRNFGSFVLLGGLHLELAGHAPETVEAYERSLDIANGVVEVRYRSHGIDYCHTIYASHPNDVVVIEISGGPGASLDGVLRLEGAHREDTKASMSGLAFEGEMPNGRRYAAVARMSCANGDSAADGDAIRFRGARAITVCIAGVTDYAPDASTAFKRLGSLPGAEAAKAASKALLAGSGALRAAHAADYRSLFAAMSLDLGRSTSGQRALDVANRLELRARKDALPDPELEMLYFQFGRYLTIAGSRGVVPSNLQGLWLVNNDPPWRADFHTDVNLQMNYWLPDRANLPSCFDALSNYCVGQFRSWERLTQRFFNDPRNKFRNSSGRIAGWTVAMSLNIDGGLGWWWQPASNAWLCNALWQHYEFTLDASHLARIYPLMKSACMFWEARLVEVDAKGADGSSTRVLVDDHDWSPEQGPADARGISYAQELVWELFANYRRAADLLGRDEEFALKVADLQRRLHLPRTDPETGMLQEWMAPTGLETAAHRHLSPLAGLFPGDRIRPDNASPSLLSGTRRLLERRGMNHMGWGNAWRACCWARLKDGERAYQLVVSNLAPFEGRKAGTAPNLLNTSVLPPNSGAYEDETATHSLDEISPDEGELIFQIDGNLGTPAAMAEMLLYSRPGHIEILPALPSAWAAEGRAKGLPARGAFVVDVAWRAGRAVEVELRSVGGTATLLLIDGKPHQVRLRPGERRRLL